MRSPALTACVAIVSLITGACTRPLLEPGAVIPVTVSLTCADAGMQASISPYVVQVPEGDQVEWKIAESSTVSEIEIDKKQNGSWPYDGALPYRGGRENPPKAGRMKGGLVGRKFGYTISGTCTSAGGEARRIVIDPDMIIIRRVAN